MDWLYEISINKSLQEKLYPFLDIHGVVGLEQALQSYALIHQEYICKFKTSITKIKTADIYYLEVHGHSIIVHTQHGIFRKYGSLNNELNTLTCCGFVRCNQSCIISLSKVETINNNDITLTNKEHIHLTRSYAQKVISAFYHEHFKSQST